MNEWHDLFVATAGSAAALTGLIFVGVSINLTRILSIVKLPERALLTNIPITILILSILVLIPGQRTFSLGLEILIAALIVWIFAIRMDFFIYRKTVRPFEKFYRFNLIINQVATIPYLISAILLLNDNLNGIYWIVTGFILCFIKSIAWVLLIKINR